MRRTIGSFLIVCALSICAVAVGNESLMFSVNDFKISNASMPERIDVIVLTNQNRTCHDSEEECCGMMVFSFNGTETVHKVILVKEGNGMRKLYICLHDWEQPGPKLQTQRIFARVTGTASPVFFYLDSPFE